MKQLLLDQPTDSMQHPADSNPAGDKAERRRRWTTVGSFEQR